MQLIVFRMKDDVAAEAERTSFVFDSMLRLSYFLGNYYPRGGSQAFADELALRCPVMAEEMELTLLELRSGFSKEKALTNLALRTGVEDVDRFASMLIQADRFGTSLADSLRVLSEMLRTKRRMLAEEQAAKIALKLLFPLIFFIFPTLLLVLLGPAFIQIYRVLLPTMTGQGG